MRIEIVEGDAGWPLAEALDREVYPPQVMATVPWRDIVWAHADRRVLLWLDERVVGHVGFFLRDGSINGSPVRIAGIGGVMTSAGVRRQGIGGAAMKAAAVLMKDHAVDFGLLFCESHNVQFYAGLGWRGFKGRVFCEQPFGRTCFDLMPSMILPLRLSPRDGVVDLRGLPW